MLAVVCLASALSCISCGGAGGHSEVAATPGFSLNSTSIEFANQDVGIPSAPQSATLTNAGNASLTISSIEVTGSNGADFTLTNNCGSSLAPSDQCTLTVTFKPSSAGTRTASVMFADNAAGSPQKVNLAGTGIAPAASLSTTSLSFGTQAVATTSAAQTVTLTNTGSASLVVTNLAVVGANLGDFAEITTPARGSVAAGGSLYHRGDFHTECRGGAHGGPQHHGQCPGKPADGEPFGRRKPRRNSLLDRQRDEWDRRL